MCLANLILQGGLDLSNALMVNNHWVSICMPKRVHYICLVNNLFTFPAWCHDVLVCNFLIYSGFPFRLHAPVHQVVSLPLLPPSPLPACRLPAESPNKHTPPSRPHTRAPPAPALTAEPGCAQRNLLEVELVVKLLVAGVHLSDGEGREREGGGSIEVSGSETALL